MHDRPNLLFKTGDNDCLIGSEISVHFGGLAALDNVTIEIRRKTIVGLIGPNGAGKTTLVNVLTGFQKANSGRIFMCGKDLTDWAPHRIAQARVARTFQSARLFPELTVSENVEASAVGARSTRRAARARAQSILDWMGLSAYGGIRANALPYGDERRVAIARALALTPHFLLLDEPAAGLNETECDELIDMISRIPDQFGCGVLLIEHNMQVIMGVCRTLHVLDGGRTIAEGPLNQVRDDPQVIRAYLGSKGDRARVAFSR